MFSKGSNKTNPRDFSASLDSSDIWDLKQLNALGLNGNVTATGIEPVSGLLAIGTDQGSVYLRGNLAASYEIVVPGPKPTIKFINFLASLQGILITDSRNSIHVYELNGSRSPTLAWSKKNSQTVNVVVTSPCHSHAFIGLNDGQCITYDMERLCSSPYTIPNLWAQYEDRKGVFRSRHVKMQPMLTDVTIHPRDLSTLLLAYEGGVVLWNIIRREAVRMYELTSVEHRVKGVDSRAVTCLAVHPSGQIFAVGHMDGSISFWSFEDAGAPLALHFLPTRTKSVESVREPIFKMAWSSFPKIEECKSLLMGLSFDMTTRLPRLVGSTLDYAGGETTLTILGGIHASEPKGITVVQFPPCPPDGGVSQPNNPEAHRRSPLESLQAIGVYHYPSWAPVDDFLLIPRESPHFSGAHDPLCVVLLSKWPSQSFVSSAIQPVEFPPPLGVSFSVDNKGPLPTGSGKMEAIPFGLGYPTTCTTLVPFRLPSSILTADNEIKGATLLRFEKAPFLRLLRFWVDTGANEESEGISSARRIPLRAGIAVPNDSIPRAGRFDPFHLLITHQDLSITFYDFSQHLLSPPTPLKHEYPQPLPHLTIPIMNIADHASLKGIFNDHDNVEVDSVYLTSNTLECLVKLSNGILLVYVFRDEAQQQSVLHSIPTTPSALDDDDSIVIISDLDKSTLEGFHPFLLLDFRPKIISCVAVSNVGFHAIGLDDGSLAVVDMRGPRLMKPEIITDIKKGKGKSHGGATVMMCWAVVPNVADPSEATLQLAALTMDGFLRSFVLHIDDEGEWSLHASTKDIRIFISRPEYIFLIDADGDDISPTASTLPTRSPNRPSRAPAPETSQMTMVICSSTEARCYRGISSEKIAKASFPEPAGTVDLISKSGGRALVVFSKTRRLYVFSVPSLEPLNTLTLPGNLSSLGAISSDGIGHFTELILHTTQQCPYPLTLYTMFTSQGRARAKPYVNFSEPVRPIPPHPVSQSADGSYTAWLLGPKIYSGQDIDAAIAGPNRPPRHIEDSMTKNEPARDSVAIQRKSTRQSSIQRSSSTTANSDGAPDSLYQRLAGAVQERGESLGGLEDAFNSLGNKSKDLAEQAKRLTGQNTPKRFWF